MIKQFLIGIFIFLPIICFAQEDKTYESKLIKTERLNFEYMDFGGEGVPLIVVQGVHNYFDKSSNNPYINYENKAWIDFFSSYTENYHVLAPLKRGFGKTDPQMKVDNIQTSTLDLISFMNEMEFEKAFFIGRDVSAQTMLYLAENYPEKIHGLIFIDPRFVFTNVQDKETSDFIFFSYSNSFSDSEYEKYKMKETELYRPQIYTDSSKKINVPALLFYHAIFSSTTVEFRRIEKFIQWVQNEKNTKWNKEYNSTEIANYFEELSNDKKRMTDIKDYLEKNNPTPEMYEGLKMAFGDNLIIFNETNMQVDDVKEALMNVYAPIVNAFLFMSN